MIKLPLFKILYKKINKSQFKIMVIVIIAILFIGSVIGFCIFLNSVVWTKIIGDFLNRIWGKADSVLSTIHKKG